MKNENVSYTLNKCLTCIHSDGYKSKCKIRQKLFKEMERALKDYDSRIFFWDKVIHEYEEKLKICIKEESENPKPIYQNLIYPQPTIYTAQIIEFESSIEYYKKKKNDDIIGKEKLIEEITHHLEIQKLYENSTDKSDYVDIIIEKCRNIHDIDISMNELTKLIKDIKTIIQNIDNKIDKILNEPVRGIGSIYKSNLKSRDRELEILADKRYQFSKYLGNVEKDFIVERELLMLIIVRKL